MAEYGIELEPDPPAEEETAALVRHAEAPRRLAEPLVAKVAERGSERALPGRSSSRSRVVLAAMEDAGVRSTRTAWGRSRRGSRTGSRSSRRARTTSRARSSCSARRSSSARILFEKLELTPGRKGKTGYSTDSKVLRAIRARPRDRPRDRGVARADEAREHVPRPAADADRRRTGACTRRSTRPSPRPGGSRRRTRTCRRSRSAPSSAARSARRSSPSPGTGCSPPTTRRSSCASSRTSPASRSCGRRSRAARTSTRATAAEVLGKDPGDAHEGRARRREDDQLRDRLRHLRLRALREPRHPEGAGAGVHRRVPRPLPARAGVHRADDRAGGARTATRRASSVAAARFPSSARRTGRRAASASASP